MHIGFREIILYGAMGLAVALVVNHYAGLDVPVLNSMEASITGLTEGGGSSSSGYDSVFSADEKEMSDECRNARAKVSGDTRVLMRKRIKDARAQNDDETARELEDRMAEIDQQEQEACRGF